MSIPASFFVSIQAIIGQNFVPAFGFSALAGIFTHTVTADRQNGPYSSLQEMVDAGFTELAAPEVYYWGQAVFSQSGTFQHVDKVIIGRRDAGDLTWTDTLDAVNDADSSSFYYFNIESRVDGDISQACAWAETKTAQAGPPKLFRAQSPDIALTEFLAQQALSRVRSFGTYHGVSTGSSDGYVDGAWWSAVGGYNLDAPGGTGNHNFIPLKAVVADDVTGAFATAVYDANSGLFGSIGAPGGNVNFTSGGTNFAGTQGKNVVATDWAIVRLQEALLNLLIQKKEVPMTNGGFNLAAGTCLDVLQRGVSYGHFNNSEGFEPTATTPPLNEVDLEAGIIPVTCTAYYQNSAQKIEVTLYLNNNLAA